MNKNILILAAIAIFGVFLYLNSTDKPNPKESLPETKRISSETPDKGEGSIETLCSGKATPSQSEGPYYKPGAPVRENISGNLPGEKLTLMGYVFDTNCNSLKNIELDFWQADSKGVYDNTGFNLRGRQFTAENGKYELETIVPADYGSRPPHIHVKLKTPDGKFTVTSQIYFPEEKQNETDTIYNPDLDMEITNSDEGLRGSYNFVLSI